GRAARGFASGGAPGEREEAQVGGEGGAVGGAPPAGGCHIPGRYRSPASPPHQGSRGSLPPASMPEARDECYLVTMVTIERVQTGLRIERNTLKVLKGLAEYLDLSLGDLVEGIVLHAFD